MATKKATTAAPVQTDEVRASAVPLFATRGRPYSDALQALPPAPVMELAVATRDIARGATVLLQAFERDDLADAFRKEDAADDTDEVRALFGGLEHDALRNMLRASLDLLSSEANRVLEWANKHHRKLEVGAA